MWLRRWSWYQQYATTAEQEAGWRLCEGYVTGRFKQARQGALQPLTGCHCCWLSGVVQVYYHNSITGESSWSVPDGYVGDAGERT